MLGRFPGKPRESALPKNQIELVCPLCGAVQREPRLVLTTFCRKCGEHLRVEKGGRVVASARVNPVPSSVYPAISETVPAAVAPVEEAAPSSVDPEPVQPSGEMPPGIGKKAGLRDQGEADAVPNTRQIQGSGWPSAQASPAAGHRTREQGGSAQYYFKEVECFDCGKRFTVGRAQRAASCPACSAHISLEDLEISSNSTTPVRTRGDVVIGKSANLQTAEVRCRNLKLFGALSAVLKCSGEFFVRATGTVIGEVRCHRLVVDKGCDIHFVNSIFAEEVEVRGRILGHIQCSGPVSITATGLVHGDVTARAVSIEPGGQIDGAMNIVRMPVARSSAPAAFVAGSMPRPHERQHPPGGETRH